VLATYGDSPVAGEIRTQRLPKAALKEARKVGSVTALQRVLKEYPDSVVTAETRGAIHALFAKALDAFRAKASRSDAKMLPFVERLMAWLEHAESPNVAISFRITHAETLALADKLLSEAPKGKPDVLAALKGDTDEVAAVSPHFTASAGQAREGAIVDSLQGAFGGVFPQDILKLEKGERRGDDTPRGAAAIRVPTLDIDYKVGWSGATYGSADSNRKFVGIEFDFDVLMRIPGEAADAGLEFALKVAPPEHFTVRYSSTTSKYLAKNPLLKDKPSDSLVYDVMAAKAFEQLSDGLRGVFFAGGPRATAADDRPLPAALAAPRLPPLGRRGAKGGR